MAWILGGIAAGMAVYKIDEIYDSIAQPIHNYFKKEEEDKNGRIMEDIRQDSIDRTKKLHTRYDVIRKEHNLDSKRIDIKLINDSKNTCTIVYVNKYLAKDKDAAIEWAKKVIDFKLMEDGLRNKINTKKITLQINSDVSIVQTEINEYYIVLNMGDKCEVLNKHDYTDINISITKKFTVKDDSVDVDCKFFWW